MNRRVFSRGSIALLDALRLVAAQTAATQIKTEPINASGRRAARLTVHNESAPGFITARSSTA
jgi:hypothetical protein